MQPEQLRDEVMAELELIRRSVDELSAIASEVGDEQDPGLRINAAAGALLHSFYNGVESILKRFAHYHGVPLPKGERYHVDLLDLFRADEHVPPLPPLLHDGLGDQLDPFRRFRHFFRSTYSFQLDWSKLATGAASAAGVFGEFERRAQAALPPSASSAGRGGGRG